ncbi:MULTISPECIES: site-specific integrase [unclassified Sphingomonas]|jgi:integrase|nr:MULTISPECIES: site-specific integrase [unclassified Sphingomonas]
MAFVTDKEELKPGLVIFRRADVQHRNWYCRVKVPKVDRYKTVSLKTDDINTARSLAWDQDGEVRYATKRGDPVFNRPFRDIAKEFLATQVARAKRGEISKGRPEKMKAIIEGPLNEYVGSTQVHRIGDELWGSYPAWRRENGEGRAERNGGRKVSPELAAKLVQQDQAMIQKARAARKLRAKPLTPKQFEEAVQAKLDKLVPFVSDATIRFEMSIFGSIMQYAIKKRYVPASQRFDDRPQLKKMRRDELNHEEYVALHTHARTKWISAKPKGEDSKPNPDATASDRQIWYRTVAYNFMLIMCNTGMRPSEAKNLRWCDITPAKDRDGNEIVVLFVQGKGKSRKLVAVSSVGKYLARIREQAREANWKRAGKNGKQSDPVYDPKPTDTVFTTIDGTPAKTLYGTLVEDMLTDAGLRVGPCGTIRSTYSFRHTYATYRLSEGVDVYLLAEQMGTSVKMIEDHYGHVNTIKHADRVLQGAGGWNPVEPEEKKNAAEGKAKASKASQMRDQAARPAPKSRKSRKA